MLTQKRLKELVHYDKKTGIFTRKETITYNAESGDIAGSISSDGYIEFRVDGDKLNNPWSNLRHVSQSCNMQNCKISTNNKSGFNGVFYSLHTKSWQSQIMVNGKRYGLGGHDTPIDGALARVAFEDCLPVVCNHRNHNRVKLRELGYLV